MEAKKIKLIIALMVASMAIQAQTLEIPKREFGLSFSKDRIELSRGESGHEGIT